jgi:hypothetical protein
MDSQLSDTDEPEQPVTAGDPLHLVVGQDDAGRWIVAETHGMCGGMFASKDAALRFAKAEIIDRKADLALTSERLEFRSARR